MADKSSPPGSKGTLRKKRYGRCRICQQYGQMTKEHVPPKKAFNDQDYLRRYAAELGWPARLKWESEHVDKKGIYLFTICEKCNNSTGRLYGTEYVKFVKALTSMAKPEYVNTTVEVELKELFPSRVIKQVVSMVLSTSHPTAFDRHTCLWNPLLDTTGPSSPPEAPFSDPPDSLRLNRVYDELRRFVTDKNAKGLPSGVRLYAHVIANPGTGFHTGIFSTLRRSTGKVAWLVVVGVWPIHWTLLIDGDVDEELLDVTDWACVAFKERQNKTIKIPCRWAVGMFPLDRRSPLEYHRDSFISVMRQHGFDPKWRKTKDELFAGALRFAHKHGKWTREGYLMTQCYSGTYFEDGQMVGFIDGASVDIARKLLKSEGKRWLKEARQHNDAVHKPQ